MRGLLVGALGALTLVVGSARAVPTELFFSEYIEGSSNNKALEIYNGTGATVDLAAQGYNVQMFFNGSATAGLTINLTGTALASGDVYVLAQSSANPTILAQADQTNGAGWFNGDDAVVLRRGTTVIDVIGQVGSDPGTEWGSGLTSTADNTLRRKATIEAGDANGGDAFDPAVEWEGFATDNADNLGRHLADDPPSVFSTTPASGAAGVPVDSNITITFSEDVAVSSGWYSITCGGVSQDAVESGGPRTFTLDPVTDFGSDESCAVAVLASRVTDLDTQDPPDNMARDHGWAFSTAGPTLAIHDIQGAAHVSPRVGEGVATTGIVTAERTNGYYVQDPSPDADDATSEGIFVFTGSAPTVNVGDSVCVGGTVTEFRAGGASSNNLSLTELTSATTTVLSSGNGLPPTTVVGAGGRMPPTQVIEDDATGSVETSGAFDPAQDGIDFHESLEAMRVQLNNPVAVGPSNSFGEIFVLSDDGAGASVRTARGGVVIRDLGPEPPGDYRSGDFNPERIQLDDAIVSGSTPDASVGDHFDGPAVGILDYDFGNFELNLTAALTTVPGGLAREVTAAPGANELAVATFNVENLDALEPQSKFDALAAQIVENMRSPDIVSLEEIQDNNGATNDSVVDADQTLTKLVAAIQVAGGPTYDWRQINPVDDQDGGEPGGNIRVGFIFRTDRGLSFVDRPGGDSTTATGVVSGADGPELTFSPGRVDPTNAAWNASRKPLAGEFVFRGERFFVITNHFNSKGGDQPLFGRFQPPNRSTETQRHNQAGVVNSFVDSILAVDPNANVIVLGDINDFEFSQTMAELEGEDGALSNLMSTLPQAERYSYVFEGNSQSLDHIVVSNSLLARPFAYDAVHVNAEFFDQLSDHDPQVARFQVNTTPSADAGGPYSVGEGGSVTLTATGSDPDGDALSYEWDLDDNGTFETAGQTVTFSAATLDGPSSHTVRVRVSDGKSAATDGATVSVTNLAPSATLEVPGNVNAGFPFTIALTGASDPSAADTAAGFTYAFDCGDGSGYSAFSPSSSRSCPTSATGTRSVGARIRDKDGGISEYTASVDVIVTVASLCELTREYSSKPGVADALCEKLEDGAFGAYRNQVAAQTGKAFTRAEAAILRDLSRDL